MTSVLAEAPATELRAVEALMLRLCPDGPLGRAFREHLTSGGKRLRARLVLRSVEALGGAIDQAVPWAAACELLHNATLVHDDLQDGDRLRRGRPALWVRHGTAQAINAGDLGLMLPFLAVAGLPDPARKAALQECLARRAVEVACGQADELRLLAEERLDWPSYQRAVRGKTAALFSLPVEGSALLAGRSAGEARDLGAAFAALGLLFQIQDDVLDLFGDKGRGETGSDLREGRVSALVVEHLRLHPLDAGWLLTLLRTPRERTGDAAVAEARGRFAQGGALAALWVRLDRLRAALAAVPSALLPVADELCARALRPIAATRPGGASR